MRIATLGSCLSRRTVDSFVETFGGALLSCVYHNRSDTFLRHFVDRSAPAPTLGELEEAMGTELGEASETPRVVRLVALNQTGEGIGRHMLPNGLQFLHCLEGEALDLVVMDNFMDTAAFLWQAELAGGRKLDFFTAASMADRPGATRVPILDPVQSAANMRRVIAFIRARQPGCRILFLTFPFNTYGDEGPRRIWAEEFCRHFSPDGADVIPPLTVPKRLWTEERGHYKPEMYFAYAGLVRSTLGFRR